MGNWLKIGVAILFGVLGSEAFGQVPPPPPNIVIATSDICATELANNDHEWSGAVLVGKGQTALDGATIRVYFETQYHVNGVTYWNQDVIATFTYDDSTNDHYYCNLFGSFDDYEESDAWYLGWPNTSYTANVWFSYQFSGQAEMTDEDYELKNLSFEIQGQGID